MSSSNKQKALTKKQTTDKSARVRELLHNESNNLL